MHPSLASLLIGIAVALPAGALAQQGEIAGRVLADSARLPVAGVQVSIPKLGKGAVTDSAGRFRLAGLPRGDHWVMLRSLGFRYDSAMVEVDDESVVRDFTMVRQAQSLPGREIVATTPLARGKMAEFAERQKMGIGHFVSRAELEKYEGGIMTTGGVISKTPGTRVVHGFGKAWVATARAVNAGGCVFCGPRPVDRASKSSGARPDVCYMDVYLDGVLVYSDTQRDNSILFDVNSIPPEQIEGIEVYSSAAQVPLKYNKTGSGCGVVLIWTRI